MKLNQVIAIEKGIKKKVEVDITAIYKTAQKPSLFDGFTKTYTKKADDGEDVPPQKAVVQFVATRLLDDIADRWTALFDVTAQKDYANCNARADVVTEDGKTILTQVPATYLLFLEKKLTDLYTLVNAFPTLDAAEEWTLDPASKTYRTAPAQTTRTKKVQRALRRSRRAEEAGAAASDRGRGGGGQEGSRRGEHVRSRQGSGRVRTLQLHLRGGGLASTSFGADSSSGSS